MSDMDKKARKIEEQSEKERVKQDVDRILEQDVAAKLQEKITEDPDLIKNWRFHNTKKRFFDFVNAVSADRAGRVAGLEAEIDFFNFSSSIRTFDLSGGGWEEEGGWSLRDSEENPWG